MAEDLLAAAKLAPRRRDTVANPRDAHGATIEKALFTELARQDVSLEHVILKASLRNGVPAILLPESEVGRLMALTGDGRRSEITVDLPAQTIAMHATGERIAFAFDPVHKDMLVRFAFDPVHKDMLVRGLSAVDVTLEKATAIEAFERAYFDDHPWLA